MIDADLEGELERRSPGAWEIYRKTAESRELEISAANRGEAWRREEGWAVRWWEGGLRVATASDRQRLAAAIPLAAKLPVRAEPAPRLPSRGLIPEGGPIPLRPDETTAAIAPPPELFVTLAQLVSEKSRGEAVLASLMLRRGRAVEEIRNSAGGRVHMESSRLDGVARAFGRRGPRACERRSVFRWDTDPDLQDLAGRLADGVTLPLTPRGPTFSRGACLLDPAVAAALLAALAPLFCGDALPRWVKRGGIASRRVTIADDASADAPFDGEGTPTRRVVLIEDCALVSRLHDLRSAARAGAFPTGHGVRPSYRNPPRPGPRRLFFETARGVSPRELLAGVARGIFARALTAPVFMDVEADRYEVEFTGVAVIGGRASEPVAGARASGRISELLARVTEVATDRQFFPMPYPVGAPTILVEKVNFE
ncbi:MAG TPA: metallopeptidase TldD-related protein [Thermoanaerobaculia bacterium]|jgi:predicted Zn-dependent protease